MQRRHKERTRGKRRSDGRQNAVSLAFFLCAAAALLLRFAISPEILNRVMNYSRDATGSFYEKLHFGTYAIFLLTPFVLFSRPFVLKADEIGKFRWLARYILWMLVLVAYLVAIGRAGSSGFLIDSYVVAAAAGLM